MGYTYLACHPLGRQLLAPVLNVSAPSWSETVNGNSSFNCTIAIPASQPGRDQLRGATEPDYAAIYVRDAEGKFPFAGIVMERAYSRSTQSIKVTAVSWRTWLYRVFLGPKLDLTGDNSYSWTQQDQLLVARQIVGFALTGGIADGRPPITIGTELSGKLRDLNIKGLNFKYAGELLDTMAQRAGGFEWDINAVTDNSDGLPRLKLTLGFPEIGSLQTGIVLKNTPGGANMTVDGDITRSSADRRTRVWTTGVTETLPFAVDSDPDLSLGGTLLAERVTSYPTVLDRTTLASHARAERDFLNPVLNMLTVTIPESTVGPDQYSAGDRVRLIYRDTWEDMDFPAVRIVERTVTPDLGAGAVKATLDLTDFVLPETDAGTSAP